MPSRHRSSRRQREGRPARPMRRPGSGRLVVIALATMALAALALAACGDDAAPTGDVLVADTGEVAALAALPDGGLRYGVRETGQLFEASATGEVTELTAVDVGTGGQRGLLGLAVDDADRTFASWTEPGGRLVLAQVAPGPMRHVWRGPSSTDLGNGGHLAVDPDGALVIGVGDLEMPGLADDPAIPNGKVLRLDPDGPASQDPEVLSSGYTNPFAFAFTPGGALWVFDNATKDDPERLLRGDEDAATPALEQTEEMVPSGLAALSDESLVVCGFLSGTLETIAIDGDSAERTDVLADGCSTGVIVLADSRLAFADGESLRTVDLARG